MATSLAPEPSLAPRRDPETPHPTTPPVSKAMVTLMVVGLLLLVLILIHVLLMLWPAGLENSPGSTITQVNLFSNRLSFTLTLDARLLLLVMVAGGIGSYIHVATSFADYVGNRTLKRSWLLWYVLRPTIGMGLALIFYLVLRGGFLAAGEGAAQVNVFGITALGALAGMFSKQATDKLQEVFDTLFRTAPGQGDAKRKDKVDPNAVTITALEPASLPQGSAAQLLKILGTNFSAQSVVRVNDAPRPGTFVNAGELNIQLTAEDLAQAGELKIVVYNPLPIDKASAPAVFRIT